MIGSRLLIRPLIYIYYTSQKAQMPEPSSLADLTSFVQVLLNDCVIIRCDEGLYICQGPPGEGMDGISNMPGLPGFVVGRGEIAAHIRAMTAPEEEEEASDEPQSDGGGTTNSDSGGSSSTGSSTDDDTIASHVVVNVHGRRKKRRRK